MGTRETGQPRNTGSRMGNPSPPQKPTRDLCKDDKLLGLPVFRSSLRTRHNELAAVFFFARLLQGSPGRSAAADTN